MTAMKPDEAGGRQRPPARYDDLRAVYVNGTLKRSPATSHTQGLMDRSMRLMRAQGVAVESIRLVDHEIAPGVEADMREHGWAVDAWPEEVWPRIAAADILVVGTPLWLGAISSVARAFIERIYAMSGELAPSGQAVYYGKVGGVIVTGNEDGVKHAAASVLYALQHVGFTVPPEAEAGWIGEIGPGPSYLDPDSGGPENDFTNRHTAFLTWNLLHLARLLKDAGGIPAYGNLPAAWQDGERFGLES